jgi:hypothetical protein
MKKKKFFFYKKNMIKTVVDKKWGILKKITTI